MKKKLIYILIASVAISQAVLSQTTRTLTKVQEIQMPKDVGDLNAGSNGAAVAWHPAQKKYYAAMAGNAAYVLAVFNKFGLLLSTEDLQTQIDLRGLWYNSNKKILNGNGYDNNGWFHYNINDKGIVNDIIIDIKEMKQPDKQSVGTYMKETNEVIFYDDGQVACYSNVGSFNRNIKINLSVDKGGSDDHMDEGEQSGDSYNFTTVLYTGKKNAEFGLLNTTKNQLELYSKAKGILTQVLQMPGSQLIYTAFNFSYANDIFWFFDKETRIWTGYK